MRVTTQNGRVELVPDQSETPVDVHQLSENQFRSLGLENVAYIRPALTEDGEEGCAIHAADGSLWPWWMIWKRHGESFSTTI